MGMHPYKYHSRTTPPRKRRPSFRAWVIAMVLVLAGITIYTRLAPDTAEPTITLVESTPVPAAETVEAVAPPPAHFSYAWLEANPPAPLAGIAAEAVFLVDLSTRTVLYAVNEHERRAPASTTKILTAVVVLENSEPAQEVVVSQRAGSAEPNVMGLKSGEVVPIEILLYGMMLDSGNDAAIAVAEGTFGYEAFVDRMNAKVRELGLQNTEFSNPTGYDEDVLPHYSSAYDLAVIAKYALEWTPAIITYAGTKNIQFTATQKHGWYGPGNLNRLLWTYTGVYGLKPGYTPDAGYCLVAVAERGGRHVLAVVLGSTQHFTDAAILLDYGFARASD